MHARDPIKESHEGGDADGLGCIRGVIAAIIILGGIAAILFVYVAFL